MLGAALPLTPAETRQFFRIVDAQADRMRRLIQDLLDVTQIETGSLPLTPEPAAVAALVATARTAFLRGGATNTVDLDLPPDLPRIQADRPRIIQVLGILFATAARFAPDASTIRVTARGGRRARGGGRHQPGRRHRRRTLARALPQIRPVRWRRRRSRASR